jgi:tRNA(Ile)-lysidine synthase
MRYDFYCDVAQSVGARRIALGHTEDDQVETILMHVTRGTGLTGLRGMQPVTRWQGKGGTLWLLRPLLEVRRVETEEYCRARGLEPRRDVTNYSPAFLRNRIRHEVIPLLQSCDRSIGAGLLRTARAAADDLSFLDGQVTAAWGVVVTVQPNGILLNTSGLLSLHPSLQRHLLRRVVGEILGDLADIHAVHVEVMMDGLTKQAGKKLTLPRGLVFLVGYQTCLVTREGREVCPLPPLEGEHRLNVPGETVVAGWRARARITTPGSLAEGFKACLDFDQVGADLAVRGRRAGDRFQPLGMAEPKKLQDFMVDAKVPREWRDRVPLVCSTHGVVWVVGRRIAEWAKVTDATKQVLCLEFERSN